MSFDNSTYPNRKDNRRPYPEWVGAKAVSRHCRNHGGCSYCLSNRRIRWVRELLKASDKLAEFNRD
jgi:hypothetical protein